MTAKTFPTRQMIAEVISRLEDRRRLDLSVWSTTQVLLPVMKAALEAQSAAARPPETRADFYQRASADAFAALQTAAMDAIDTARIVAGVIEMLESSTTIDPDERTSVIARLQQIPAARDPRPAAHEQKEKV